MSIIKPPLPLIKLNQVMPKNFSEFKCGPNLEFDNGSCYPLELLILMAEAHNKDNKIDQIDLTPNSDLVQFKRYLLLEFNKKYGKNQQKWSSQSFVKYLSSENKNQLQNDIFRPEGPQGKFDWLSSIDINNVMKQYESKYPDFEFLGSVPIDFESLTPHRDTPFYNLIKPESTRIGLILNLDTHDKSGSHWVSLFADLIKGEIYFSDSTGTEPVIEVTNFMNKIEKYMISKHVNKIDKRFNKYEHQKGNSECGVYSINFIIRLLKGKTFDHITKKRLTDEKVNKCRMIYFKHK